MSSDQATDFLSKVSILRQKLDGQTIVSVGSVYTAEAREPDRKRRLMYQLTLARQLRAKLEQAADRAEGKGSTNRSTSTSSSASSRWQLLEDHTPDINTLVSLTLAVRNGYTLDEYNEFNKHYYKKEPETREKDGTGTVEDQEEVMDEDTKNHRAIVEHLTAMSDERNGIATATTAAATTTATTANNASKPQHRVPTAASMPKRRRTSTSSIDSDADGVSMESNSVMTIGTGDVGESTDPNRSVDCATTSHTSSGDEAYHPPPPLSVGSNSHLTPLGGMNHTPSTNHPRSTTTGGGGKRSSSTSTSKRSKRRTIVSKRCHDCKSSSTAFRRCHYWFLTGTKCSKVFCSKCLVNKYGVALDVEQWDNDIANDDPDWHCPSCLGTCLCADCVREQKRALKNLQRETSYSTRRT